MLPAVVLYAFLPIRIWADASVVLPSLGMVILDTLMAVIVSVLIIFRLFIIKRHFAPRLSSVWALWLLLLLSVLSAMTVGMMGDANGFKQLLRLTYPILVFLLVWSDYREEGDVQRVIVFFIATGVMVTLAVFIATLLGFSAWRWSAGVDRFAGLGSVSDYAFAMGLMTVLSYVKMRIDRRKVMYGLFTALFVVQTLITVTRGAIFATVFALIMVELFGGGRRLSSRILMITVLISLILSAVTFYAPLRDRIFATNYRHIASQTNTDLLGKFGESFTISGREGLWGYVYDQVLSDYHVILGFGSGTAETNIVKALGGIPHNEYMRVLYELGFVGLVLFIILLYQIWKAARSLVFENDEAARYARACCIGVLTLYAFGAMFDNMISKYKNMGAPLFVMFALVLARKSVVLPLDKSASASGIARRRVVMTEKFP